MNEPQLTDVHTPSHEDSPSETVTRNTEIPLSTVEQLPCGYAIREEIARGGMGVVYRGHDAALNREVAIKILQDKYDPNGFTAQRFVEEAQITGQLQHPGIPPIHHVGTWHDGRPFLAMKLIKGRTLEEMIKAGESFNVLAVFEAIAHAVGYAHAHRVIHRDLKPANIMVGSFGEVQVMDWGLAKLMDRDGQEANAIAADPNATTDLGTRICSTIDEREVTQDGDILGTPAFMPPEQAIGAIDEIDARSDVFGLGAVLCAMLTGKPPYLGENAKSTRQMAARGKLNEAFARLDASQAEPELIALCKRCLNVERWQRPADGNTVAQEVAKLRTAAEERAKQAELNEAKAEVRSAEQAKRRHLMNWSAAVVMGVLAAGVTVSLWQAKVALREAWNARTAEVNAERQFQAAQEARVLAETNEQRANDRTKLALDAYGDFVFGIQNQLANRPGTQDLRRALLETARKGLAKILDDARKQGRPDTTLMWSYFRMGDVEQQLGNTLAAQKEYQVGYELAKSLADAVPKNPGPQRDLGVSYNKLGDVNLRLGQTQVALDFYEKSLAVSQRLADTDPKNAEAQRDLSISCEKLGDVQLQLGQTQATLDLFEKGLSVRQRLADADPKNAQAQRDLSISYGKLGDVQLHLGQTKAALDWYEKSLAVRQRLANADPKNAQAQRDLGISFNNLGNVQLQLGQTMAALDFFKKALAVRQRLADADPKNAEAQRELGITFEKLGIVHQQLLEFDEAAKWFEKSIRLVNAWPNPKALNLNMSFAESSLKTCQNAEKAIADIEFAFQQPIPQISQLLQVRTNAMLKRGQPAEAVKTAKSYALWAETLKAERDGERYNVACCFALCAAAIEQDRETLVDQSIALLRKAKASGYFTQQKVAHIKKDRDFNGIRTHPKFVAFLAELTRPRELAPPPRAAK